MNLASAPNRGEKRRGARGNFEKKREIVSPSHVYNCKKAGKYFFPKPPFTHTRHPALFPAIILGTKGESDVKQRNWRERGKDRNGEGGEKRKRNPLILVLPGRRMGGGNWPSDNVAPRKKTFSPSSLTGLTLESGRRVFFTLLGKRTKSNPRQGPNELRPSTPLSRRCRCLAHLFIIAGFAYQIDCFVSLLFSFCCRLA